MLKRLLNFRRVVWLFLAILPVIAVAWYFLETQASTSAPTPGVFFVPPTHAAQKDVISQILAERIKRNEFPPEIDFPIAGISKHALVNYSLHAVSQTRMEKQIGAYRPDYAAFVAIDATTGRILNLISYSAAEPNVDNLTLRATFPAASIFKVVTASAALDLQKAEPETVVAFNGANHTLYRKNVEDNRVNRWTRHITMREAFARSINTVFAKLGLFYVGGEDLKKYAERFLFNRAIPADLPVEQGVTEFSADDRWSVVSAASGFTRATTMSPLHGALIAAAVANDGTMMEPYIVDSLQEIGGGDLYRVRPQAASVVFGPQTASRVRALFIETVQSGTSRKWFRKTLRRSVVDDVEFGGKTGSLTGESPRGKCDWFVGYAIAGSHRIAVGVLTVNERRWRVKASELAAYFFANYLEDLRRQESVAHSSNQ